MKRGEARAAWIEELAGDRRGEFVDLIAYHCEAAPQPGDAAWPGLAWPGDAHTHEAVRSRAVKAQLEAGWAARTRFAIDEAIGFGDPGRVRPGTLSGARAQGTGGARGGACVEGLDARDH